MSRKFDEELYIIISSAPANTAVRESIVLSEGIPLREAERAVRRLICSGRLRRASLEEFYAVERDEWQARLDWHKLDQLRQRSPWLLSAIAVAAGTFALPYYSGKFASGAAAR